MGLNDDFSGVYQQDAEKGIDQIKSFNTLSFSQTLDMVLKDTLDNGLKVTKKLVIQGSYSIKCPYAMDPTRIVIHNTYNDAPAVNEISYMINNNSEVSFHFAVDDTGVVQGVPLNRNCWHAGDGSNGIGNRHGIAIEICYSKSGGERFINSEKNAAKLVAYLLFKANWEIEKITKHQDYSGKYCPHRTLDMGWKRFLDMCRAELDKLIPPKEPFPVGTVVYNTVDLILESTIYENGTKAMLPKNATSKIYKYMVRDSTLWAALSDINGKIWTPAAWTKQLDKLTTVNPNPPLNKDEEISSLKKRVSELEASLKDRDKKIAQLTEELSKYKK